MGAHAKIGARVRPLADGSVVLPKSIVDALGWTQATELELVRDGDGIAVRPPVITADDTLSAEEVFARLAAINPYRGPTVTIEEMDEAVREMAVARYERSCDR